MHLLKSEEYDLTILMPCLNEEKTIGYCLGEAKKFIEKRYINAELLIADNGSTDKSIEIAKSIGARVVKETTKGYGAALRTGLCNSQGRYIIFADCDSTYDFEHLELLYEALVDGADAVIGNRFAGGFQKDSSSFIHRLGVRFLSQLGRMRFHSDIYDFHCGLRGISRKALEQIEFNTDGFEFATEFIGKLSMDNYRIDSVPVILRKSIVERTPHLKTISDGLRHLTYIINYKKGA